LGVEHLAFLNPINKFLNKQMDTSQGFLQFPQNNQRMVDVENPENY
jgi:hypothetical protein